MAPAFRRTTQPKKRQQKKSRPVPHRLKKLEVSELDKKLEMFDSGVEYRFIVGVDGPPHKIIHTNRLAVDYFGIDPEAPGILADIFARATRKERIVKLRTCLSNGREVEKDFQMFFQPHSPDPDNRKLPVLCAIKLEILVNSKNKHCASLLSLKYRSEITADMEQFCVAKNGFAHADQLGSKTTRTDFGEVQKNLSELQLKLAEYESQGMYAWMEKDAYFGPQSKTSIVTKKSEGRMAISEYRTPIKVPQERLFSGKYRILGQTKDTDALPDGVIRPVVRPANHDVDGHFRNQLVHATVNERAREKRQKEEQIEMQQKAIGKK